MKKWILVTLACCCGITKLMSQEVISVKTTVQYKGDTVEVKLKFDVSPGLHVYAPSLLNESQGYISMKLSIDELPAGLKDLKLLSWSESAMEAGGEVYREEGHSVVFRLLGKPKQAAAILKGTLSFQACNEEMCFSPDEKAFSIELKRAK